MCQVDAHLALSGLVRSMVLVCCRESSGKVILARELRLWGSTCWSSMDASFLSSICLLLLAGK